jgi:hypothetical protein
MEMTTLLDIILNQKILLPHIDYNYFSNYKIFKKNYSLINNLMKIELLENNGMHVYKIFVNRGKIVT